MSDERKAVFLSYASQDAEAARRIADALRSAGVEVWFDQSELVGGDAWDQKIRRQINSCALFVPIISSNTQARTEGYFRLEWRLAEQRTHLMAKGRPFLVPIVIDDTRDAEAHVPDAFLEVQWSRFPEGNCDAKFAALVQRMLSWDGSAAPHPSAPRAAPAPTGRQRNPALTFGAITAVVIGAAVAIWVATRPKQNASGLPLVAPSAPALSEADQLVAKAWDLMNKPDMARAELDAADDLCKQAAALDPNDASVWAAWSQVDSWYVYHALDQTPVRQEGARTKAARAMSLAPNSYEARLAQACYLVREGGGQSAVYDLGDARKLLEALLRENPDEPRALWALGILLRNTGNVAGYRDAFTRMAKSPGFAVEAYNELGWAEFFNGNPREAEAAADASIALQPYWANLNLKSNLLAFWWGDLEKARAAVDRISGTDRQEDYAVSTILLIDYFRRDPDAMLRVTNRLARDWLESNAFDGPVAWWNGLARKMAGQADAAQLQWRTALTLVERRLADQPGSVSLLRWKARLLLASGNQTEGATAMRLARETGSSAYFYDEATDDILLGDLDGAVTVLAQRAKAHELFLTAAYLRLSPEFDRLHDRPRFQALLARLEADPKFSPNAKPASASSIVPPDKSVAVLAFANLSDDKDNEYFSDGISEELLNVLAKVPGLKVTARSSSFYFKGRNVPVSEVAQQLGVAYVVEGSVRKQGDRVRISAQLIKASDGFNVWSETFSRDLKDIFAVQDEIAGLIAEQMQLKLGATQRTQAVNPEAHRLLLEARFYWNQRGEQNFDRTEVLLKQALAIDPDFAPAHAAMADLWAMRAAYRATGGASDVSSELSALQASVTRALELDPTLVEPYAARAYGFMMEGKWDESEQWFGRALALRSDDPTVRFWHALLLMNRGDLIAAAREFKDARRLDPFSFVIAHLDGECVLNLRRTTEAIELLQEADALRPGGFVPARGKRAALLWQAGRKDEAVELARSVRQSWPAGPRWDADAQCLWVLKQSGHEDELATYSALLLRELPADSVQRGWVLSALGRVDEALPFLEHLSSLNKFYLANSPLVDSWRNDPRFHALLKRLDWEQEYDRARAQMQSAIGQP